MTSVTVEDLQRISNQQMQLVTSLFEKEKSERMVERTDDIKSLKAFIETSFNSKINAALQPISTRQDEFEKRTEESICQISAELAAMKESLSSRPSTNQTDPGPDININTSSYAARAAHNLTAPTQVSDLSEIIEAARLTLGFEPIEQQDIDRLKREYDISDINELMKRAVIDFLRLEMGITTINPDMLVKVFPQSGVSKNENRRYYAQFSDPSHIATIYSRVSSLRSREQKVVFYAPATHQNQLSYLGSIAYKCRYPTDPKLERCKTRIRFGSRDLYLQVKPLSKSYWTTVDVPNLPLPQGLRLHP